MIDHITHADWGAGPIHIGGVRWAAVGDALAWGVKVTGVTVHFVTAELDGGPIVRQTAVPVRDDDTADSLAARILVEEHRIYPEALRAVLAGGWRIEGRRFLSSAGP